MCGLLLHYCLCFEPKLGKGKCTIRCIPCACNACTYQLVFSFIKTLCGYEQPIYNIPQHFVYSNVFCELNEWNVTPLTNKYIYEKVLTYAKTI